MSGAVTNLVRPSRLVLQEDGHYLWTATETGIAAIDTETTGWRRASRPVTALTNSLSAAMTRSSM